MKKIKAKKEEADNEEVPPADADAEIAVSDD